MVFLVREDDAGRFLSEHPTCDGADLKRSHSGVEKATVAAKLATFEPPVDTITHTYKRGGDRFPNERGRLTEAGACCLQRKVKTNLIVWRLWFRCAGLNTYQCDIPTSIHHAPDVNSVVIGSVEKDHTVIGITRKELADKSVWIQLKLGWVRSTATDGTTALRAAGCARQCGGVCVCTSSCKNQLKSRHGCDLQIKMERTLEHVQNGLVRITVSGAHAPDMSRWRRLPPEHRAVSPETRQVILQQMAQKNTARKVQLQLNITARSKGASTDGRGAVIDHSVVPEKKLIQQIMTDHRRSGQRGVPAFEAADAIIRKHLREPVHSWGSRCIYYRRPDPAAHPKSDRGLYQTIFSSDGCLDDAAEYGDNGHLADGTHKVVEDDVITDAVMVQKPCTAQNYPSVPELHSGHRKIVSRLVCLSFTDKENEHAIKRIHESIRRCMRCRNPRCKHRWEVIDFADGSGFYSMRLCHSQIKWNSPGMLDHHEASVNAYIALGLNYFLCLFHKEKAIIDYLSGQLLLTGVEDMSVFLRGIHMLARTVSKDVMLKGWKIFCSEIMPKMRPSKESCQKFVSYFESIWMSPKYISTWPDWGRTLCGTEYIATSNAGVERYWQEYKKVGCMDRILKRLDELFTRVTGYGPHGLTPTSSVMDMAALEARDQDSASWKPSVLTDVRRRHHLAGCILICNALSEVVPGKVYAVRAGAAPACLLRLDLEDERELDEARPDSRTELLLKPLHELICEPTLAVIKDAENAKARPTTAHYLQDLTRKPPFCSCPDHTKRGGSNDSCKHVKAATLYGLRGDAAARIAGDELVRYMQARGVEGTADEILGVIRARLAQVESAMAVPAAEAWCPVARWFPSLDFRPAVRNISSVVRPGPERREVKLRHAWRHRVDTYRPATLKGAANRGGGAKRRAPERSVGHKGGALARAIQRSESGRAKRSQGAKKNAKQRRMQIVAAARQRGKGQIQLSLSSIRCAASVGVRPAAIVAPAISEFMARAQTAAGKLFTF